MSQNIQPSTSKESVKRLRFTADDDLALLREFVALNPLEEVERWEEIQKNIFIITGKKFSIRTLKDHLFLILDIFLKKDKTTQIMSVVEEMHSERDQLLQEVSDMCQKTEVNPVIKKRKTSKEKQISELGKQSRDECARQLLPKNIENLSPASTPTLNHNYSNLIIDQEIYVVNEIESNTFSPVEPAVKHTDLDLEVEINAVQTQKPDSEKSASRKILAPKKSRTNKSGALRRTALDYLQNKEAKEQMVKIKQLDLEQRRLDLEERRLVLDEKRLQMEVAERKEKLEMEQTRFKQEMFERDQQLKLIEQQHKLIVSLMETVKKYENK